MKAPSSLVTGPLNCLEEGPGATNRLSLPHADAFDETNGLTDSLLPLIAGDLYDLSGELLGAI
jgi:hypothetical protein